MASLKAWTSQQPSIAEAARRRLPLQFHFPQDTASGVKIIEQYRHCARQHGWDGDAEHLHTIPCLIAGDEASARERMTAGMRVSFHRGDRRAEPRPLRGTAGRPGQHSPFGHALRSRLGTSLEIQRAASRTGKSRRRHLTKERSE